MVQPVQKSARQKPTRIVVNLDRAQPIARAPQRRSRFGRILGIIAIAVCLLALGAAIGGYFWWQSYKSKPAYTLALLVDAVERNDMAAFDQIADTDKIVQAFVPQVTEKATGRYASALTGPLRKQVESLVPTLLPTVKQKVRDEVIAQVKEMGARAKGQPFVIVALAIPYIVEITEENGPVKVTVNLKDRPVVLTMTPNKDRWKIVAVADETLAQRIIDSIAKDLPAVGSQMEKEVRRKIKKNLPGGLPNVPLLDDNE